MNLNVGGYVKSSVGIFALRMGRAVVELVGVIYVASAVGASNFGSFSLFAATVVLASVFTDLGITEAAKKRISEGSSQREFFTASLLARLSLYLPVAAIVVVFRGPIASYIGTPIAVPFLLLSTLFLVIYRSLYAAIFGQKRVARSVSLIFLDSFGKVAVWMVAVALGFELIGLFAGYLAGKVVATIAGVALVSLRPARPSYGEFDSLTRFAKYSWLGSLKEKSWLWTDTLILGLFVASGFVGIYEISWRISGVFFFVASAVSSTLFPRVSELSTDEEFDDVQRIVETSLVYAGVFAIPGLVGGLLLGEGVLSFFGEEYTLGYPLIAVLILARIFHSYEIVFEKTIHGLNEPRFMFRANAVFIPLNLVSNVVLILTVGWQGAAVATTVAMFTKMVLVYHYTSRLIKISLPVKEIGLQFVAAAVMAGVLFLFPFSRWSPSLFDFGVLVTAGVVSYVAAVLFLVGRIREDVTTLL